MYFSIRDDDTSYFTKPEELIRAYDFIESGPISLSVVPMTVPIHRDDVFPYGEGHEYRQYDIQDNAELINFLRDGLCQNKYEILLHGYSHEYKYENSTWVPEMLWKTEETICRELICGKKKLERLFGVPINVFVAPNNGIDKRAIHAIERLQMDYSGIIQFQDRDISIRYIINFLKRWTVRALYKVQMPGILNYGKHKELCAYTLDSFERLRREYDFCKSKKVPFVVYTHYWQINLDPNSKRVLKQIYDYAINDGAKLVPLSTCFKEYD